jgi:hypothetical protein
MNVRRWFCVLGAAGFMAASLVAIASATESRVAFKCGDPKLKQLSIPLRPATRGYQACSDGATGIVKYRGATYKFGVRPQLSGVCQQDPKKRLQVDIGAIVTNGGPWKTGDPAGFHLATALATSTNATHSMGFGLNSGGKTVKWDGPIAYTKTGANSGTFKDAKLNLVNGKFKWAGSGKIVTGSWSCTRVLAVPD